MASNPLLRLMLFIDIQNTYRSARRNFFNNAGPSVNGQFDPAKLGQLIEARGGPAGATCALKEIRAYTGRPDPRKDNKTYAAHMKQCDQWQKSGVTIVHRELRYPPDWPAQPAQEKGIDTALAIDFVTMAVDAVYDIGVIMSTDTDLLPALEFTHTRYAATRPTAIAAWRSPQNNRRLSTPGYNIWCHWLRRPDYDTTADPTNYNR